MKHIEYLREAEAALAAADDLMFKAVREAMSTRPVSEAETFYEELDPIRRKAADAWIRLGGVLERDRARWVKPHA